MTLQEIYERFFSSHTELVPLRSNIEECVQLVKENTLDNKKILLCGNGGSNADCEHIAGELLKSFILPRKIEYSLRMKLKNAYGSEGEDIADNMQRGVKCIPLTSFPAFQTAFANDCDGKYAFAQLVNVLGTQGDILIAISTSGNSENVLLAAKVARILGLKVVGLTGKKGGRLAEYCDILLNAPTDETYQVQEYHECLYHLLCMAIESELFYE